MQDSKEITGSVTVEPEVLVVVARLSALGVEGVAGIADWHVGSAKPVVVKVKDGHVVVDLHLIAGPDLSLLQLGRKVQHEVTRAIERMIGMPVDAVNIQFEDIAYPGQQTPPAPETELA